MLIKSKIHLQNSTFLLDLQLEGIQVLIHCPLLISKVNQLLGSMTAMRRSHLLVSLTSLFLAVIVLLCPMTEMHKTNQGLLQVQAKNFPLPILAIVQVLHKTRQAVHHCFILLALVLNITLCLE